MGTGIPSAFRIFRPSNSGSENGYTGVVESVNENMNVPMEGFVDFDQLPTAFHLLVSGSASNSFGPDSGHLRVRIGGSYAPPFGAAPHGLDGTIVLERYVTSVGTRGVWSMNGIILNVWSGFQPVKLGGWGWSSAVFSAAIDFIPIL